MNKNGFTLVELLAVIVILALLIVVVANTAIPAMNNAKKRALETYAARIVQKAKEYCLATPKECGENSEDKSKLLYHQTLMGADVTAEFAVAVSGYTTDGISYHINGCVSNGNNKAKITNDKVEIGECPEGYTPAQTKSS